MFWIIEYTSHQDISNIAISVNFATSISTDQTFVAIVPKTPNASISIIINVFTAIHLMPALEFVFLYTIADLATHVTISSITRNPKR
jgi:hypothetical protein